MLPLDLNTAYTANDNGSISGLSNEDVTLSDTTLDVSSLNTLDGNTSGTIDASNITTLTGAAADLNTAYTANDNGSISGLSNEDVTLSDTTLDVSSLNTLDGNTAGTIDASTITTLTGSTETLTPPTPPQTASQVSAMKPSLLTSAVVPPPPTRPTHSLMPPSGVVTATLSDGDLETLAGLSETGNAYSIIITDASVDADEAQNLYGENNVAIDARKNITTLTGTAADIKTSYSSIGISGLDNKDVTI